MNAYGKHGRSVRTFLPEPIEGGNAIRGEIIALDEVAARHEAHVVAVKGIGHHDMPLACDLFDIWQIIVIGVGIVEKPELFNQ